MTICITLVIKEQIFPKLGWKDVKVPVTLAKTLGVKLAGLNTIPLTISKSLDIL